MKTSAHQFRPQTIKAIKAQTHLMPFLEKIVQKRTLISLLLYGKPGIGKTSLAYALCHDWQVTYSYFNAATDNKKKLVSLIALSDYLIIDEIHRLHKDKQDILLSALEKGKVRIIATTTENPYFVINPAVRSRLHILELKDLLQQEIVASLKHLITTHKINITISDQLLKTVAVQAQGDYRYAINVILLLAQIYEGEKITKKMIKIINPQLHFYSDRDGDEHYDLLSAFHKSLRGSDENAALYYFAKLIASGDLIGMERRLIMVTYEDVGLAQPNLALRVKAALDFAKRIGFPEARIILANVIIDICKAPKSNAAIAAIDHALHEIEQNGFYNIPAHLRDSHYSSASKLGRGQGYEYPHDYGGHVNQQYLPTKIKNKKFYIKNKHDKV